MVLTPDKGLVYKTSVANISGISLGNRIELVPVIILTTMAHINTKKTLNQYGGKILNKRLVINCLADTE